MKLDVAGMVIAEILALAESTVGVDPCSVCGLVSASLVLDLSAVKVDKATGLVVLPPHSVRCEKCSQINARGGDA